MRTHMCKILQRQSAVTSKRNARATKTDSSNKEQSPTKTLLSYSLSKTRFKRNSSVSTASDILRLKLPISESEWEQTISMCEHRCVTLQQEQQLLQAGVHMLDRRQTSSFYGMIYDDNVSLAGTETVQVCEDLES